MTKRNGLRLTKRIAVPLVTAAALVTQACSTDPKDICGVEVDAGRELIENDFNALEEAGIELNEQIIDEVDWRTKSMLSRKVREANCPTRVKARLEMERDIAMTDKRIELRSLKR